MQPKIKGLHIIVRMNVGGHTVQISNLMRGLDPKIFDKKLIIGYCEQNESDYLELNAPEIPRTRTKNFWRCVSLMKVFLVLVVAIIEIRATSNINEARFDYWASCQTNDLGL